MKIVTHHAAYPSHVVRRATRWASKQIGMPSEVLRGLTVEVGFRRNWRQGGSWGGWYRNRRRLVQVQLSRVPMVYPQCLCHNARERAEEREARDEWELFVSILAHELEHARVFALALDHVSLRALNSEPRVRSVDWRATLAFRADRTSLLADWTRPPAGGIKPPASEPTGKRLPGVVEWIPAKRQP